MTPEDEFWLEMEQRQAIEDYERERLDRVKEYAGRDAVLEIESREFETVHDRKLRA